MKTLTLLAICAVGMAFGQTPPCPAGKSLRTFTNGFTGEVETGCITNFPIRNNPVKKVYPTSAKISFHVIDDLGRHCYATNQHPDEEEALDVPAIQEPTREPFNCSGNALSGSSPDGWYQWGTKSDGMTVCGPQRPMVTTCKDKTRILEHDEQGPPKYWCRKVQN